jgi:hypothetical protein
MCPQDSVTKLRILLLYFPIEPIIIRYCCYDTYLLYVCPQICLMSALYQTCVLYEFMLLCFHSASWLPLLSTTWLYLSFDLDFHGLVPVCCTIPPNVPYKLFAHVIYLYASNVYICFILDSLQTSTCVIYILYILC